MVGTSVLQVHVETNSLKGNFFSYHNSFHIISFCAKSLSFQLSIKIILPTKNFYLFSVGFLLQHTLSLLKQP